MTAHPRSNTDILRVAETPSDNRRRIYLVDPQYQMREVNWIVGAFMALILLQLLVFALIALLLSMDVLNTVRATVAAAVAAFLTPTGLCAVYSWYTVRRTHRVAGAAYRLTQDVPRMLKDPKFRFHLRDGDYLWDLAEELNKVMGVLAIRRLEVSKVEGCLHDLQETCDAVIADLPEEEREMVKRRLRLLTESVQALHAVEPPPPCDSEEEAVKAVLGAHAE